MESYLNENFGDLREKHSSEEALQRWRKLCWFVKNRKRRFRFTDNLSKRYEDEAIRRRNQEKFRVAVLATKAGLEFMNLLSFSENDSTSNYTGPEDVSEDLSSSCVGLEPTSFVRRAFGYLALAISFMWVLSRHLAFKATSFVQSTCDYLVLAMSSVQGIFSSAVLGATSFAWNLSTRLVLEAALFARGMFCHLVLIISFVRELFSHLVLAATSFAHDLFSYHVLAVSYVQDLFGHVALKVTFFLDLFRYVALEAISFVRNQVTENKWGFLAIVIAVYACAMGRTSVETRLQVQRQQVFAHILHYVVNLIIRFIHFYPTSLVVEDNYGILVFLLVFAIMVGVFIYKKYENVAHSSHNTLVISSRDSFIPNITRIYSLSSTASWLFSTRTTVDRLTPLSALLMNSSLASPTTSTIDPFNMFFEVHNQLRKYMKHALVLFYLILEAISSALDQVSENRPLFLLVGVLLSAFSFALTIIPACLSRRSATTTWVQAQRQVIGRMEILFSSLQLLVSVINFVMVKLDVEINYSTASVYTLVFAMFVVQFVFRNEGCVTNSSRHTDHNSSGDSAVNSLTEIIVDRFGSSSDLSTISSLSYPTPPATSPVSQQYQSLSIEVYTPNTAVGSTMFTSDHPRELHQRRSYRHLLYGNDNGNELMNIVIHDGSS